MECYLMGWDESAALMDKVAQQIRESGYMPEVVVGISRGGLVPARILCDRLGIKNLITIKMEHWGTAVPLDEARVTSGVHSDVKIRGKKVLLVDDLTDTGDSLQKACEHVRALGPADVRTAVMEHKKCSKFTPDYYARALDGWQWIVHPWAVHEDIAHFVGEAIGAGKTTAELVEAIRKDHGCAVEEKRVVMVLKEMESDGKIRNNGGHWVKG